MHRSISCPATLAAPRDWPCSPASPCPSLPRRRRDLIPYEKFNAGQRLDGDRAHRPQGADRGGQPVVPRRLEEREARQDRFRPPVRAPDVPGHGALQRRVLQAARAGRCHRHERHHQFRPHQLLPERPDHGPRPGACGWSRTAWGTCSASSTRRASTSSAASCRTRSARARTDRSAACAKRCSAPASRRATRTTGCRSVRWRTSTPPSLDDVHEWFRTYYGAANAVAGAGRRHRRGDRPREGRSSISATSRPAPR